MSLTVNVTHWIVRITGVLQLILGLLIWAEHMANLVNIHILIGVIFVLSLWLLAATAATQGVPIGMALGAALLGLLTFLLGFGQRDLLPDPSLHWIVQLVHLLLGMLAVGSGEMIGGRLRRARLATA
jgi:hypothetical protein